MQRLLFCALAACALIWLTPAGQGAERHATRYPGSVVALGNDQVLGYGSDPGHPYRDAPANSWATGTNPAVNSIYNRILAMNPAVRGHNRNLGHDEANVRDLVASAQEAVSLDPKPELVLLELDGDIRCDAQDADRVSEYKNDLTAALGAIAKGLPKARIFVVSSWGSFASYVKYLEGLPKGVRLKHAGKGLCQFVDSPSGRVVPSHVAYVEKYVTQYEAAQAAVCKQIAHCRYDGGAAQRMTVTAADISLDQEHLSLAGEAKLAAIEWRTMAGFVNQL
jgi:hypothetical protein